MKTTATTLAVTIAAFLIGLSFASKPATNYVTPEYGELLEKSRDQQATITSLEFDVKNLQAECLTYRGERDDLRTKADSLTVQLAESQKARQGAGALPVAACAEVPNFAPAVPSAVPQYQPRRRLFGRFR